jgi:hypothetical protein
VARDGKPPPETGYGVAGQYRSRLITTSLGDSARGP